VISVSRSEFIERRKAYEVRDSLSNCESILRDSTFVFDGIDAEVTQKRGQRIVLRNLAKICP
jgi:hypothetical protein